MVKDPVELEKLQVACELSDAALAAVLPGIKAGDSERTLALRLDHHMALLGADRPAFDTIVASGPNGAIPHHVPTDRQLAVGDLVTMDFGALYDGYHADMTRTVAIGAVADWQRDIYELVALAQQAGIAALCDGVEAGSVDAAARDLIEAAGHSGHFQHGLGHGVGLEIHEAPMLGYGRTGKLSDAALAEVLPGIKAGDSERTLALRLDHQMALLGADRPAFDTIVASGPNGAIPHHVPTDRPLARGDLVTMDFGALYDGYHADMTRDRKSTRLNSSHSEISRMPSSA